MKTNGSKNESTKQQARRWALNWMEAASEAEEAGDLESYRRCKANAAEWAARAGDATLAT